MPRRPDILRGSEARRAVDLYSAPLLGLNTAIPASLIDPQESVRCENMRFSGTGLELDIGYKTHPAVLGEVHRKIIQHQATNGTLTLLLITNTSVYRYVVAVEQWQYISNGNTTSLSVAAVGGASTITVNDAAGFANGEKIGILLNNGAQHKTTVVGAPVGNVITLAAPMPSVAGIGNTVVEGVTLTGNNDDQIVVAFVPWEDWTIFTNGVNPPMRYDGSTVEPIPNLPNSGDTVCKTLDVYKDHIILGNLTQSAASLPYNVVWGANGNGGNWTTEDSGANSLTDTRDPIVAMKKLGDDLIIYRSKSMVRVGFVGTETDPFSFTTINFGESILSEGVGAVSPNAVFAASDHHLFVSFDGVYKYGGGLSIDRISNKVFYGYFDKAGEIDRSEFNRLFVHYLDELNELWIFYCTFDSTFCNKALILNRDTSAWRTKKFAFEFTSATDRSGGGQSVRYVDLIGLMGEQTWTAVSGLVSNFIPAVLLTSFTGNGVYECDFVFQTEDQLSIIGTMRTKEFNAVERSVRLASVHLEYYGGPINVSLIALGEGALESSAVGTFPTSAVQVGERIAVDREIRRFQLEFITSTPGTKLVSYGFSSREGSRNRI